MSLRKKLISSISALCLLVLTLVVGVWAVTSATYNLGGTVSFIAKGVSVRVYDSALLGGTYEGQINSNVVPENKMQSFEVDTYKQGSQSQFEADEELKAKLASWTGLALVFFAASEDDEVTPLQISFKVQNTSELGDSLLLGVENKQIQVADGSRNVTLRVEAVRADNSVSLLASTDSTETAVNSISIAQNEIITVRLTFTVDDALINAKLNSFVVPLVFGEQSGK